MIGLGLRLGELEVLQIGVHVRIEIELALLDQLHHRGPGEQLRRRAWPEQRLFRIDRNAFLDVRVAVTLREQQSAVLDHRDRRARDGLGVELDGHGAVDELGQLRGGKRLRERPRLRGRVLQWPGTRRSSCGHGRNCRAPHRHPSARKSAMHSRFDATSGRPSRASGRSTNLVAQLDPDLARPDDHLRAAESGLALADDRALVGEIARIEID